MDKRKTSTTFKKEAENQFRVAFQRRATHLARKGNSATISVSSCYPSGEVLRLTSEHWYEDFDVLENLQNYVEWLDIKILNENEFIK